MTELTLLSNQPYWHLGMVKNRDSLELLLFLPLLFRNALLNNRENFSIRRMDFTVYDCTVFHVELLFYNAIAHCS